METLSSSEEVAYSILNAELGYESQWQKPVEPDLLDALHNIRIFCAGRSLFVAEQTEVCGLAPMDAQHGDVVAIMLGCKAPMVLRPSATQTGKCQLIGEAYCDGFTHGEALLGPLPKNFTPIWRKFKNRSGNITYEWSYLDTEKGNFQVEDPRLGLLPIGWETVRHAEEDRVQFFKITRLEGRLSMIRDLLQTA